jgi:malic enzyme
VPQLPRCTLSHGHAKAHHTANHCVLLNIVRYADAFKEEFVWPVALAEAEGFTPGKEAIRLLEVVKTMKPTVLIGASGVTGAFTEEVVEAMAAYQKHPVIFPLSNPTSLSEATPADIVEWTNGNALIAAGSPTPPVSYGDTTITIGQGNNVYIFPAVGLASLVCKTREVVSALASCHFFGFPRIESCLQHPSVTPRETYSCQMCPPFL